MTRCHGVTLRRARKTSLRHRQWSATLARDSGHLGNSQCHWHRFKSQCWLVVNGHGHIWATTSDHIESATGRASQAVQLTPVGDQKKSGGKFLASIESNGSRVPVLSRNLCIVSYCTSLWIDFHLRPTNFYFAYRNFFSSDSCVIA